jgi:DtxR family Mn-dependent transcriptional regulator
MRLGFLIMDSDSIWLAAAGLLLVAAVWVSYRKVPDQWRRYRQFRRRVALEDVLKHLATLRIEGGEATADYIAGHLGVSRKAAAALIVELEAKGLVATEGASVQLTEAGERWAIQVLRAHRLWETYLADEARVPLAQLHRPAEHVEHWLTPAQVDHLEATLGHPRRDPHGDPIPTASGEVAPAAGRPLTSWPVGEPAEIVHIEDEPDSVFQHIGARGWKPGTVLRVVSRSPEQLTIRDGETEWTMPPLPAGSIYVAAVSNEQADRSSLTLLSELGPGETARVVSLGGELRGFTRRRLLDLGLTPNARVSMHLRNAFGDPLAFRVRGTTVALRREQASGIWVRREPASAAEAGS